MRHLAAMLIAPLSLSGMAQHYTEIIELLQADLHHDRKAIVLANMTMTPEQQAVFEPILDDYTRTSEAHWTKRMALVDDFAKAQEGMTNDLARSFMERLSELDEEKIELRGEYAERMDKVLPAMIVARWVQLERRLSQLMELQVSNEVPLSPATR